MLNNLSKTKFTLWGVKVSPYVRKVMIALAEKNLPYEQIEILPKVILLATGQNVPAEFDQMSHLGKIPTLQINDVSMSDSAVIAAYLDKKFVSGNRLYPENPEAYAKALWFERYSDEVLTSVAYRKIFLESVVKPVVLKISPNQEVVEQAQQSELPPLLNYLEKNLGYEEWFAGKFFSMADVAIATQLLALRMAGFEIDSAIWPRLNHFLEKICLRPSFKNIV